jgi:hypothetical protein
MDGKGGMMSTELPVAYLVEGEENMGVVCLERGGSFFIIIRTTSLVILQLLYIHT